MFHEVPQENELTVHSNTISVNMLPQNVGSNEKRLQSSVVSSLKAEEEPVKHTHLSLSLFLSHSQFAASFHRVLKTRNTEESQGFIFGAKFRQNVNNKNKRGIFCHNIPIFSSEKNRQISPNFAKMWKKGIFWHNIPIFSSENNRQILPKLAKMWKIKIKGNILAHYSRFLLWKQSPHFAKISQNVKNKNKRTILSRHSHFLLWKQSPTFDFIIIIILLLFLLLLIFGVIFLTDYILVAISFSSNLKN